MSSHVGKTGFATDVQL